MRLNTLDWIALALIIIGGLNWGLIGFFDYDLVASIFGSMTTVSRVVYVVVGISAVYLIIESLIKSGRQTTTRV